MKRSAFILHAILILAAAGPWATSARAQSSRKDDVIFNTRGQPLAGAKVRVCTATATTTPPCTPLALIYSDAALTQSLANPLTTDGMGNYNFYAAPGRYVIEISGQGIITRQMRDVILPSDPSGPMTAGAISAFSLALTGNLTVSGSTAVTGTLTVGGAPVPSTTQANTWTAPQQFNGGTAFKGPSPWHDVAAFEPNGAAAFNGEEINGTIASGSHTLTLASAGHFLNLDYVGVAGAGPATSLATPTIASVAFTPASLRPMNNGFTRASNVVTVTLMTDASITSGDSITIAGATGCATSVNGTFTVASAYFPGANGNKFTFAQTGANETCGGTGLDAVSPATIVVNAGSAHYDYKVACMDYQNGLTASSAVVGITNGPATLAGMEPITITVTNSPGAASCPLYRRTVGTGNYIYIGSSLPVPTGYARTTSIFTDYGQNPALRPINIPATAPSAPTGQILITQITAGGGTATLTLAGAAANSATSQVVYHDNSTAFQAALAAANSTLGVSGANSATVFVPPNIMPKFCNVNFNSLLSVVNINVAGSLWPVCTVHRTSGLAVLNGIGSGANIGFTAQLGSLIVTGELNPTLFDDLNGGTAVLKNFAFGNEPTGSHGSVIQTAVYMANNEQGIYKDITCGGGATGNYSPCFFVDGSSGGGAVFGLVLDNPNFSGGSLYPTPSAIIRGAGNTTWIGGRLSNRGVIVDYATPIATAGEFVVTALETENVADPYLFRVDFTNTSNDGGMFFSYLNPADGFYSAGTAIVQLQSSSGSGSAVFSGGANGSPLVRGNCFDNGISAVSGATGNLGIQSGCNFTTLAAGTLKTQGSNPILPSLDVVGGTLQVGWSLANVPVGSSDSHHFIDPRTGGNGYTYAGLPAGGSGTVIREECGIANCFHTFESPVNGSYSILMRDGSSSGTLAYMHPGTWFMGTTSGRYFELADSASGGGQVGANFSTDLTINFSGNTSFLKQTYAGGAAATVTWQAVSGTPALTSQLPATLANASHKWLNSYTASTGLFTQTQPDYSDLTGTPAPILSGTTASIGGSSVATGTCVTGTASVTSSTTSMAAAASPAADPGTGFTWNAWVSAAGTVTVRVCNISTSAATPTATAFNVRVIQ